MASLLEDVLFDISGQAKSPLKDFYQLQVTQKLVIWRWWKITLRVELRTQPPGEVQESHEDFLNDANLQQNIGIIFGPHVLDYVEALCNGHIDYLPRLPNKLLMHILSFLSEEDVGRLGQTSRMFKKLCDSKPVWEQIVKRVCHDIAPDMENLANKMGWKKFYLNFYHDSQADDIAEPQK